VHISEFIHVDTERIQAREI